MREDSVADLVGQNPEWGFDEELRLDPDGVMT